MGRELLSSILRAMQAPSPTRLAQSTQEEYSHVIECRNRRPGADAQAVVRGVRGDARQPGQHRCRRPRQPAAPLPRRARRTVRGERAGGRGPDAGGRGPDPGPDAAARADRFAGRSEEHTSELQSLMRISYAVFCLKKKTKNTAHNTND